MAQSSSFNNFFNNSQSFGMNVRVQDRTNLRGGAGRNNGVLEPLFTYLQENDKVFKGDVQREIGKYNAACFNIGSKLQSEDMKVNGPAPRFDCSF